MILADIEPYKGKVIADHLYCGVTKLIEIDALEKVEAIPKEQYKARLNADMVAMLTDIQMEIEKYQKIHDSYCDHHIKGDVWEHHTREHYDSSSGKAIACDYCLKTIQQKIDKLKEVEKGRE